MTYQSTQDTYSPVGSRKRLMYWSGDQSTGAEIKKYLTGSVSVRARASIDVDRKRGRKLRRRRTVVDLLQSDYRVCGQALLGILVEKERLRGHRPSLRCAGHDGVLCRVHCNEDQDIRVRGDVLIKKELQLNATSV